MKNSPLIIGLVGKAKSGKDTAARAILASCESVGRSCRQMAFADPIRQIGEIFGFPKDALRDQNLKEKYEHEIFKITPRQFMQKVGTEMFRDNLDKDCWVKLLEREIIKAEKEAEENPESFSTPWVGADENTWIPSEVIVITDVRFPNELEMIKAHGGIVVKVERTSGSDAGAWRNHESERYINELKTDALWYNNDMSAMEWMGSSLKCFGTVLRERNIFLKF